MNERAETGMTPSSPPWVGVWKVEKGTTERGAYLKEGIVLSRTWDVRNSRHPNRMRIAEKLESKPRKKPMKITEEPDRRRHTRMKSQKWDEFQKRVMLTAAKFKNEDRKLCTEFGSGRPSRVVSL